jgi:hypothetical protein
MINISLINFKSTCEGYSEAALSGDGATNQVLVNLAERVGPTLKKLKIHNSSNISDTGLHALLSKGCNLQHVHLEEIPKAVSGR